MIDHTWIVVVMFWAIVCGLGLWTWFEWKSIDEPHSYDNKLAQWEADMEKAIAEEELKHRPHVRAGRSDGLRSEVSKKHRPHVQAGKK